MKYMTVNNNALHFTALYWMHCTAMNYNELCFTTLHYKVLKFTVLQWTEKEFHCNSMTFLQVAPLSQWNVNKSTPLHCTKLHCISLNCITLYPYTVHLLHCTSLHFIVIYFTGLECTNLHCTALHCTTLHCTALLFTAMQRTAYALSPIGNIRNLRSIVYNFNDNFNAYY